jgi:hypothetical protein
LPLAENFFAHDGPVLQNECRLAKRRRALQETVDASCGGIPGDLAFSTPCRYLDEHARLAQRGVRVIAHNTLAASDYGFLYQDYICSSPQLGQWAALLWNKVMGTTVLKPASAPAEDCTYMRIA